MRVIFGWALSALIAGVVLSGCGPSGDQETFDRQKRELDKLRAENEEAQRLRAENKELPRLRRDNQEIETLRDSADEIAKVRIENGAIQAQIAALAKQAKISRQALLASQQALNAGQGGNLAGTRDGQGLLDGAGAADPDAPREGDEILIEPRLLANILPEFDWEKLQRTEPIAVKQLLEQQGIILTNYHQLIEFGITNYVIQRAPLAVPNPLAQ